MIKNLDYLLEKANLDDLSHLDLGYLVLLDRNQGHHSESIHCDSSLKAEKIDKPIEKKTITYSHKLLLSAVPY